MYLTCHVIVYVVKLLKNYHLSRKIPLLQSTLQERRNKIARLELLQVILENSLLAPDFKRQYFISQMKTTAEQIYSLYVFRV